VEEIAKVWEQNHGQSSLVSWDRFRDLESIGGLVQCIPPPVLAAISQRLLQNYRHYRSGFPDLTIWNPQQKVKNHKLD
jgi:Fanconi-associated nuclease 1